jgi:hypothetical protein
VDLNGNVFTHMGGLEIKLLETALQQMNMTVSVIITERDSSVKDIFDKMLMKEAYIFLGTLVHKEYYFPLFDTSSAYKMDTLRWYVPCSFKYPRWSSIYRILSVELWVVLIISIVIVAMSTALVGRYSCTSEWQGYKTVTGSLTNIWSVILGVSVSTMPRAPSLRSLFLAWVCFSIAFSTVLQAFLTTFLIDPGYKTPIQSMDELLSSGMKLATFPGSNYVFEYVTEIEMSNVRRNLADCPSYDICLNWAVLEQNVSVVVPEDNFEMLVDTYLLLKKNVKRPLCRIEDGVFSNNQLAMLMFNGEPLLKRVNEIIDRVLEAGLYKY